MDTIRRNIGVVSRTRRNRPSVDDGLSRMIKQHYMVALAAILGKRGLRANPHHRDAS
jgi:hypothetical protein